MRKSFYLLVFFSALIPLALLSGGGLYFFHKQRGFNQTERLKSRLKEESLRASQKWDHLFVDLAQEALEIVQKKDFPPNSLFQAVAVREAGEYQILIPALDNTLQSEPAALSKTKPPGGALNSTANDNAASIGGGVDVQTLSDKNALTETQEEEERLFLRYQKLLAYLDEKRRISGGFFPASIAKERRRDIRLKALALEGEPAEAVFLLRPAAAAASEIAGFIHWKRLQELQKTLWSAKEVKELLLFNRKGWLFFHPKSKGSAAKKEFFKKALPKLSSRRGKFLQWEKEGRTTFAFLWPQPKTNLFIAAQKQSPAILWSLSSLERRWLALSFSALIFACAALFLLLSPLTQAYSRLKKALLIYASKGEFPLLLSSNRLLSFYEDVYEAGKKAGKNNIPDVRAAQPTFQQVLQEEAERLQKKYPNFSLHQDLQSNTALFQFAGFMKKILSALLLNGIEAMGASPRQTLTVKSFEKDKFFVFSVEDKGKSITPLEAQEAFILYHSTKSQLGVGLNLVSAIVTANGGSVKLCPIPEGGPGRRCAFL